MVRERKIATSLLIPSIGRVIVSDILRMLKILSLELINCICLLFF
jgi:hypothetical protein